MYKIIQKFVTKNRTYKILKPVGVALHETANAGSTALNHYTYFNGGDRNSLAHIFVDWNYANDIIQLAPLNECTWHAKEPANSMFISVEMCRPKTHNVEQFNKVWNKCVWLFADIFINTLKITKITKDNLMSHDEIRLKWKNTNHTDPTQLLKEYGKTMDNFRNAVQNEINKQLIQEVFELETTKSWEQITGEKAIDELVEKNKLNNPDSWKAKDLKNENTPLWLFFEMLNRNV